MNPFCVIAARAELDRPAEYLLMLRGSSASTIKTVQEK